VLLRGCSRSRLSRQSACGSVLTALRHFVYERLGKVKCSGSECTVYEGSYNRVGKVKRQGSD
jgi:hypothetical protein